MARSNRALVAIHTLYYLDTSTGEQVIAKPGESVENCPGETGEHFVSLGAARIVDPGDEPEVVVETPVEPEQAPIVGPAPEVDAEKPAEPEVVVEKPVDEEI